MSEFLKDLDRFGRASRRYMFTFFARIIDYQPIHWYWYLDHQKSWVKMATKIAINRLFARSPASATILAGFASFCYADSCRRFVFSLTRSPFCDHFFFEDEINGQWPTGSGACCGRVRARVRARTICSCSALRCRHFSGPGPDPDPGPGPGSEHLFLFFLRCGFWS